MNGLQGVFKLPIPYITWSCKEPPSRNLKPLKAVSSINVNQKRVHIQETLRKKYTLLIILSRALNEIHCVSVCYYDNNNLNNLELS